MIVILCGVIFYLLVGVAFGAEMARHRGYAKYTMEDDNWIWGGTFFWIPIIIFWFARLAWRFIFNLMYL